TVNGVSVAATSVPVDGSTIKFARELFRFVNPEIVLNRAQFLSKTEPDSTAALLWKADAARIRTRVGTAHPEEVRLFEA
ncbi:hypothetical protein, partial [Streptococcus pneumoniae]|uniref:hypothetical protein n=1 Tax=Streptococcus pneumoniae TaxID=1313 RepID=UPI0013DC9AD8